MRLFKKNNSKSLKLINFVRGMKAILKKTTLEKQNVHDICIFKRSNVGTHLGITLAPGKANSLIIGVTHAKSLPFDIKTVGCDFSSLIPFTNNSVSDLNMFRKLESRAILTIVSNNTILHKNDALLNKLKYSTGLAHENEKNYLKDKILLENEITYLSNTFNNIDFYILYQTEKKTEAVSLNDKERLVELLGLDTYDQYFQPVIGLVEVLGDEKLPIADIIKRKVRTDSIDSAVNIIKNIW